MCGWCPSVPQCVQREQCGLSDMESGLVVGCRLPRGILARLGDAMGCRKNKQSCWGAMDGDIGEAKLRQCNG